MIRIYLNQDLSVDQNLILDDKLYNYIVKVMRCKLGQSILVFNGIDGEFQANISEINKKSLVINVEKITRPQIKNRDIWLIFAIIKPHRMGYLIEKATELGVTKFFPIITTNSAIRDCNIEKLKLIAIEAAEQSERIDIPEFFPPISLDKLIQGWPIQDKIILCSEHETSTHISSISFDGNFRGIMVGPEGGFTTKEIDKLVNHEMITSVRLGNNILRAETASIAAISYMSLSEHHP